MTHAYTPGLRITERTVIRKQRMLPIPGQVSVQKGDRVDASAVVARTELPGNVRTVNVINMMGIAPEEIREFMLKKEGDQVAKDEPIAENRPFIKWFKTRIKSPIEGSIESISEVTGQVLLREPPRPLELEAYIDGSVIEVIEDEGVVIETVGAFLQGIFGIGGETVGILSVLADGPDDVLTPDKLTSDHRDNIVIGGAFVESEVFEKAREIGVKGIVVGGFHDKSLKELLGYDLGVAITGTEHVGFTLILTEGFGQVAMARKTFDLLKAKEGKKTSVNGATQIRAGVIRPEIIIPDLEVAHREIESAYEWGRGALEEGDTVRLIRDPYFGQIGKVAALPYELQQIGSESLARVLEVDLPDGQKCCCPRANVEIIEE